MSNHRLWCAVFTIVYAVYAVAAAWQAITGAETLRTFVSGATLEITRGEVALVSS